MPQRRSISDSEDEEMNYAPPSPKRTKLSNQANGIVAIPNGEGGSNDNEEAQALLVDDDGFVEGSIVKITLTNFVTYDYCEIFPGPQMNMIIGPNGTGKSTIVCAIALGLGGSPALLGRAKSIQEFVKTGEDEATIMIELKKVGVRNVIIQRTFTKTNNATTWRLDSRVTSHRDVMKVIHGFNIQVDNLCQFLPQDRVSEFAELSPSQLLERTQSAAGETELHDMQKKLMEWRDKEKELEKANRSDVDHLVSLNNRNEELERDVMRMKQKKDHDDNILIMEAQKPFIKYYSAKASADSIKESFNEKKEVVQNVQAELAPIENVIAECQNESRTISKKQTDEGLRVKECLQHVKSTASEIQKTRENIKLDKANIESIKRKIPEREREIEKCKANIERLEERIKNVPSEDTSEFDRQLDEINREMRELQSQLTEVQQRKRDLSGRKHEMDELAKHKKQEIRDLTNVMNVRLNKIRNKWPDTHTAYQFCQQNKDKFIGKIHGPVAFAINVKDTRYAAMIEQTLGGSKSSHFRAFICENQQDYKTFTRLLIDEKKLALNVTWPDEINDSIRRTAVPETELQHKYGMDHFVSDLLEGDAHVIRYLCKETNINLIPLALRRAREEELVNSGAFKKFCIDRTFYNIKTSEYGRKSKQTSTTPIRDAELIGDSVDNEARAALTEELRTFEGNIQQADIMMKEYDVEFDATNQKTQELKHRKEDVQAQKRDVQRSIMEYKRHVFNLEKARGELNEMKKRPEEFYREIKRFETEVAKLKLNEEEHLKTYVVAMKKFVDCYEKRNIYKLQYVHAAAKLDAIRTYSAQQTKKLEDAKAYLADAKKQLVLATREAQICLKQCERAGDEIPEYLHTRFEEFIRKWKEEGSALSLEELEGMIEEERGREQAIRFANPDAMKHYEERKVEIARLEGKIENNKKGIEKCKEEIVSLRGVWEPRIDDLVERIGGKFSEAFERIRCSGEVSVDKQEDFDKWGINIRVKFRDTEKLQLLTGTRQSGGERSVTTVLYLMSLQNLAKSPFRVVDEINQGMDPRNERMIHEQIVQGASKPGTSQYFLITPKLLPDLFYNDRMRVLCIYNGESIPSRIKPLSYYLEHAHANGTI